MAKKKVTKTNAIRLIEQQKISYTEHEYEWKEDHLGADTVAKQLAAENIFKTLVAVGNKNGPLVAVIPANKELDLKKVEMLHLRDLETTTGYIRGGCSPIGMKKLFPTYIDQSATTFATITISAGRRGLQMELAPKDLAKVVRGEFVDITEELMN